MALAQNKKWAFTPWKPSPIPSGYYDPNLDASRQAASRGLLNTEQDIGTQGRYGQEDFAYGQAGLNTAYGREREVNSASVGIENEDYARNTGLLTRQYQQLGRQQGEQARKYGVTSGGIALLSAAKRMENQGIEQQGLDTAHSRSLNDLERQDRFAREDYMTGSARAQTLYDRGVAGRGTDLSRARTEDVFYGQDTDAQKLYQAQQAGYEPTQRPSNQRTLANGTVVRDIVNGGVKYSVDQNGRVVSAVRLV